MADNCGCAFLFHNIIFATQKLYDNLQECTGTECTIMETNLSLQISEKLAMGCANSICQPKWPCTATSFEAFASFAPDTCSRRKIFCAVCMVLSITYLCRNNLTFEFKPTQAHSNATQTTSCQPLAFGIVDSNYLSDSSVVNLPNIHRIE